MKKTLKILVGTHNKGKFKEICSLLPKGITKISPLALKIKSPKETGKTFAQNSILKANFFHKKSKMIAISDDSGLEVRCLKNKPGIYSARWAKKYGNFNRAMKKIISLVDKKNSNRVATFVCSLTIRFNNKKIITVVGKVNGKISKSPKGNNGFGYDPIFIPNKSNLTFGEMKKSKKIKIDHRFIAFRKLKKKTKIL